MFGIARQDLRPPEVKAAAARISTGYHSWGGPDTGGAVFCCDECGEASGIRIEHKVDCETGRILDEWVARGFGRTPDTEVSGT